MSFLLWLQATPIAVWVAGADTLWAFPAILTFHTVGLGIVVGANLLVDFKLLGAAPGVSLETLRAVYRPMWVGFAINAVTGVLLFMAGAEFTGVKLIFYVKLALIAAALVVGIKVKRLVFDEPGGLARPDRARTLAVVSVILWLAAIVAGRYTAYV